MAGDTIVTIVGNLTSTPELRFTPGGDAVASFTVASTPRTFDRQSGEWRDGEALFMRCSLWRQPGENLAESGLDKGARVIVQGRLKQRSFEKDGQKRTVVELDVDEIGPSLKFATAKVNKVSRNSGGFGERRPTGTDGIQTGGDDADPWASAPPAGQSPEDEPPF